MLTRGRNPEEVDEEPPLLAQPEIVATPTIAPTQTIIRRSFVLVITNHLSFENLKNGDLLN